MGGDITQKLKLLPIYPVGHELVGRLLLTLDLVVKVRPRRPHRQRAAVLSDDGPDNTQERDVSPLLDPGGKRRL